MFVENNNKNRNSAAKIKANNKYSLSHYKNVSVKIKPDQADFIRAIAKQNKISLAQLIIDAVRVYADIQTAGAGEADTTQPEADPTKSPMKSEEPAGAQPETETETETRRKTSRAERIKAEWDID